MQSTIRYAGLDVHKATTTIAVAEGCGGDAQVWGQIGSDPVAIERELRKLGGPERVRVCYEAGPTGLRFGPAAASGRLLVRCRGADPGANRHAPDQD
jgi:hypothetical protein